MNREIRIFANYKTERKLHTRKVVYKHQQTIRKFNSVK